MTDSDQTPALTLRDHLAAALDAAAPGIAPRLAADPAAHLDLIALVRDAQGATDQILRAAVVSARTAGCTWEAVGGVLGMSRQAAQQRYGATDQGSVDGIAPDDAAPGARTMRLAPLSAFNEMQVLNHAGRYGWHSVSNGALFHVVERSDEQWEHWRSLGWAAPPPTSGGGRWQKAGSAWFPWVYYARPLGIAALPEPVDLDYLRAAWVS